MKPACSKGTINTFVKRTLEGMFEKKLSVKTLAFSSSKVGIKALSEKPYGKPILFVPNERLA